MEFSWVSSKNIEDRIDSLPYKKKYLTLLNKLSSYDETINLEDICESVKCGPFGSTILASEYTNRGMLYIRPLNITQNVFDDTNITFLDTNSVNEKNLDIFTNNDLFFGRVGNPCVSKVPNSYDNVTISPNIIGVKVGEKINSNYLWMYCSSKYGMYQVERMLKVVAQPTTGTDVIKKMKIFVPNNKIQQFIGDKVIQAEKLRSDAKKLKEEIDNLISDKLGLKDMLPQINESKNNLQWINTNSLSDRIDTAFYDPKVSLIKNHFNKNYIDTIRLGECVTFAHKGKSYNCNVNGNVTLIKTKNLKNEFIDYDDNKVKNVTNKMLLKEKDLIFATMGVGSLGKIDIFYPKIYDCTIDGTLLMLRVNNEEFTPEYIMEFLRTDIGQILIYKNIIGSTGIISISQDDIFDIPIPRLDIDIQKVITKKICNIIDNIYLAKQLIIEAQKDVEDLIEGNFDMTKLNKV